MNKKIAGGVFIVIILILIGGIFWLQKEKESDTQQTILPSSSKTINSNLINSDYGFSFSIPAGWHIWEGNSSASDLMNKTDFASVLEKGTSALTNQKAKEYQTFMDNWRPESSQVIVFTDSQTLDSKNRSFSEAGKIMSRIVDSEDILKQREVTMNLSTSDVNLTDPSTNDADKESRNIKIDSNNARLLISKKMKLVDWIIIKIPVNSNNTIGDKKVSSLVFMEYVRKNDSVALDKLVSFISSLKISSNQ